MTSKLTVLLAVFIGSAASAAAGELIPSRAGAVVPGSYIVVLKPNVAVRPGSRTAGMTVSQTAVSLAALHRGAVTRFYEHALQGFAVRMTEAEARRMADDPRVAYIQPNGIFTINAVQSPAPSWGLDRIDQRNLPLDRAYDHRFDGAGVHAYIIDTGIRPTHQEFTGRIGNGFSAIADGNGSNDCNGHGTHVAGPSAAAPTAWRKA